MVPYLMTEFLSVVPGLPGLFLACLFSAALSTLSSMQNGMATVFMTDILNPILAWKWSIHMTDRRETHVARIVCKCKTYRCLLLLVCV